MKYLLDTNVLLWIIAGGSQLGPAAKESLAAEKESNVSGSVVNLWEIRLKISVGKLELSRDPEAVLAAEGFNILPILPKHTKPIENMPFIHKDPFDRIMIAQAMAEGLTFVTADIEIMKYPGLALLDARK